MNRLQKKCLIATTGFHLFLLLLVVFGSAFFVSRPKPDDSQILTVIPATLIDAAFSSGVQNAQPPPPAPVQPPQPPQPQPTPQPPPPQPEPPKQTLMEKVQEIFKPEPPKPEPKALDPVEPADKPTKPTPKKIEVNLKPVVRKTTKTTDTSAADDRREAQRVRDQRAKAFRTAMSSIDNNSSEATEVDMPGVSSAAYANYDQAILTIYNQAWTSPEGIASGEAAVKVRVVVGRDGNVISARIIDASGNSKMDNSVQRALDRVTQLRPLPEGSKEKQRTIEFTFKARSKPLLG